jgi:hypothetical protein
MCPQTRDPRFRNNTERRRDMGHTESRANPSRTAEWSLESKMGGSVPPTSYTSIREQLLLAMARASRVSRRGGSSGVALWSALAIVSGNYYH